MRYILIFLMIAIITACTSSNNGNLQDDKAAQAAKTYYDYLLTSRYSDYVDGFTGAKFFPNDYKNQLEVNAKQYVDEYKKSHGGIVGVKVLNAKTDTISKRSDVFLLLSFADSVSEEIVVPMVKCGDDWRMK